MAVKLDGAKVRDARLNAGLTINALSAQMGVTRFTVSRTERGLTAMGEENARRMAELLGVSLRSLREV